MVSKQQPGAGSQIVGRNLRRVLGIRIVLLAGALALASCSILPGAPGVRSTEASLLPTRTLAPLRTALPVTPEPTDTVAPTATDVAGAASTPSGSALVTVTPGPTHVPSIVSCTDTKLDLGSDVPAPVTGAGRIAFVTVDGNVAMTDVSGHNVQPVTSDANTSDTTRMLRAYTYPTFSGDGKSLAFVSYTTISGTQALTQTLYVAPAEPKARLVTLFVTLDNIPYLDWSPDSKTIAFLTISSTVGAMNIISKDGGKPTVIEEGSSAYWQWRNDSAAVVTHLSGSPATNEDAHISIVDAKSSLPKRIQSVPGNFKAPAYSPNSRFLLFAARSNGNDDLVLADATGKPICAVAALEAGASFSWSPDGHRIAWIDSGDPTGNPAPLYVLDLATGTKVKMHDNAVSFFWAPNSKRLAIYSILDNGTPTVFGGVTESTATPDPQSAITVLRIELATVGTPGTIQVADTIPTRGVIQLMGFFDQYSRALTPWSPDSTALVFTSASQAHLTVDLVVATVNGNGDKVDLNRIAAGVVAFWSPR